MLIYADHARPSVIDFHFTATYVIARMAGFNSNEANIIATSGQYVDDATNTGTIVFNSGEGYSRISSAHKMVDYRNYQEMADKKVWIPFHFLPGNCLFEEVNSEFDFHKRLICKPNSPIAKKMVEICIQRKATPYSLHRLGITAHVFLDTWAHQGFLGVVHPLNHANNICDENGVLDQAALKRIKEFFGHKSIIDFAKTMLRKTKQFFSSFMQDFVSAASPVGHGAVLTYPDLPYLKWRYTNGYNEEIKRDNPKDFLEASLELYKVFCRFRGIEPNMKSEDQKQIEHMIKAVRDEDAEQRYEKWREAIRQGRFSFGSEEVVYVAKGKGSWK